MSNEHIGRIRQFGLGKQTVAGTPVDPTMWIPCNSLGFVPNFEKIRDESAYGVIDEFSGGEHIGKKTGDISGEALMRDESVGHFLKAALGKETLVDIITITDASGGTPARGDSISSTTASWTGVIEKLFIVGSTTYYAVSTATGDVTDLDAKTDLTDGTWSGGTVEQSDFSAVKGHFFERLNTNSTHPIYSLYTEDVIAGRETSDCSLESLDIEFVPDSFPKINFGYKGISVIDGGDLTPADTTENLFLAKHCSVRIATNEAGLNAASAETLRRFKISIAKNLNEEMKIGQDGAISGYLNQQFGITGDFEALFNSEVLRNYHLENSKKAIRMTMVNNSVTAIADVAADDIYPSLYIDLAEAYFSDWGQSNDLNGITSQTLGYVAHYDRASTAMSIEVLLLNKRATIY